MEVVETADALLAIASSITLVTVSKVRFEQRIEQPLDELVRAHC